MLCEGIGRLSLDDGVGNSFDDCPDLGFCLISESDKISPICRAEEDVTSGCSGGNMCGNSEGELEREQD